MDEHNIVAKAEKQVKEWIDYAKQGYDWGDEVFELFEEPMIEVSTAVAVQTTKDLQEELEQTKLQNAICEEGLKKENKELREKVHFWKKEVNVANRNAAEEYSKLKFKYDNLNSCFNTSKSIIEKLYGCLMQDDSDPETVYYIKKYMNEAEKFLKVN